MSALGSNVKDYVGTLEKLTAFVEAKAKEVAVKKLRSELDKQAFTAKNHSLIGSG